MLQLVKVWSDVMAKLASSPAAVAGHRSGAARLSQGWSAVRMATLGPCALKHRASVQMTLSFVCLCFE